MRKFGLRLIGAAGLAASLLGAAATHPAQAVPASGTFSFGQGVSVNTIPAGCTSTAGCITSTTSSKTFLTAASTVNAGGSGNANPGTGATITLTSPPTLTIPLPAAPTILTTPVTFTAGTFTYSFNEETMAILTATPPVGGSPAGNISTQFTGTFTDGSGTLTMTTASLSESCTQTNVTSAIGCTETITVPSSITPPVPEPASLALLGSALIGFGVFRRRRKAA